MTRSCYDPDARPARRAASCDACLLRLKGFAENGIDRPRAVPAGRRRVTPATLAPRGASADAKTFPVIEIFGPTIQGEGAEAGLACHFVRLGGCDYRCSWCDTMYAVDPADGARHRRKLEVDEISMSSTRLDGAPDRGSSSAEATRRCTNSGRSSRTSSSDGYKVAVETQGSVWRPGSDSVDRLTISPKPPSSGMAPRARRPVRAFMDAP